MREWNTFDQNEFHEGWRFVSLPRMPILLEFYHMPYNKIISFFNPQLNHYDTSKAV